MTRSVPHGLRWRARAGAVLGALLLAGPSLADTPDGHQAAAPETVVLLHGLGRTHRSMRALEKHLVTEGFRVHNLRYYSTRGEPEELLADLRRAMADCCAGDATVHFVGHSLGGILTRAYLAEDPPISAGRVVMLAPPNHGSEIVDKLENSGIFGWIMGPTALELGTDVDSLPNSLPPPSVEIGVIAGTRTLNPIGSMMVPEKDDGIVSLESARLDGMADFITVPSSHTFIMRSKKVKRQVVHFLRHGRFQHGDT